MYFPFSRVRRDLSDMLPTCYGNKPVPRVLQIRDYRKHSYLVIRIRDELGVEIVGTSKRRRACTGRAAVWRLNR